MQRADATMALAKASAALVDDHDVSGFLASLLGSVQSVLGADACGILVNDGHGLEVLAASSHDAAELELHQAQFDEGPCVDAHDSATPVEVSGAVELARRWKAVGPIIVECGFELAHASPLRWHGAALGAMGVFRTDGTPFAPEETVVAQAFADIATLLIVQTERVDLADSMKRVQEALATRVTIEQAKGVIAELENVPMNRAYALLLGARGRVGQEPHRRRARGGRTRAAPVSSQWLRSALISSSLFLSE